MEGSGIKGCDVILTGGNIIPEYDADETKEKGFSDLKFLNKTVYNELILAKEDAVYL